VLTRLQDVGLPAEPVEAAVGQEPAHRGSTVSVRVAIGVAVAAAIAVAAWVAMRTHTRRRPEVAAT
jgi:hypothetical protein